MKQMNDDGDTFETTTTVETATNPGASHVEPTSQKAYVVNVQSAFWWWTLAAVVIGFVLGAVLL